MRRCSVWVVAVTMAAGFCSGRLRAADEDLWGDAPKPAARQQGWAPWFGGNKAAPAKKSAPNADKKPAAPAAKSPANKPDQAVTERQREMDTLLRRTDVCLKLLAIAYETNDDDLRHLAEQLDERCNSVYSQRIAHLPAGKAAFVSDEQILNKHLGGAEFSGGQPVSSRSYSVPSQDATARTTLREEKP
jgi:hypothetical protein